MQYPDFLHLVSLADPLTSLKRYENNGFFIYNYVDRSDNKMMPLWLLQRVEFRRIRTGIVKEFIDDFFVITE
jgi:hypothetical protein